jgi:predicted thioesterase
VSTRSSPVERGYLVAPLEVGATLHRWFTVTADMLTDHVPNYPPVLMTPDLIAMLEDTAAELVRPLLAPGAAAVGTWIGVRHTGAARLDDRVQVAATVTAVDGRRLHYDVAAHVGERCIGHGEVGFTLIRPDPRG